MSIQLVFDLIKVKTKYARLDLIAYYWHEES